MFSVEYLLSELLCVTVCNQVSFVTQGPKKRRQKLEEKAGKTMSYNSPEILLLSTSIYFMVTFLFL